jgi:hypothetical protein
MRFEEGTNQCQDRHQLDQLRHSGFSVDASVHIPAGSSKTQEALSQYIARRMAVPPPLSLKKISIRENGEVTVISYTSDNEFFKGKTESLPVSRVLLELTQHITTCGSQFIRRYGLYAPQRRWYCIPAAGTKFMARHAPCSAARPRRRESRATGTRSLKASESIQISNTSSVRLPVGCAPSSQFHLDNPVIL